ncbi:homeodomain-like domain protein [Toxoplasma gondii p89]|uniref:Homeodomain-like domain protein n=1 Tax=Toxoplasma gondii p89 TaxID=943119 RepID=A0A086L3U7_TOXGO|nr:homeodomain-like domain protein [Toxoplasma gondii p89]
MAEGAETPGKGAVSAQEEERRGRSTRGRYPARTLSVSVREKETVDLGARDESDRGPQQLSPSHQKGDTGDRRDRRDNGDEPAETAEALECRGSGAGEERDAGSPQVSDSEEGRASFSVEPPSHGSSERADEKEGDSAAHEDDETRKARRERKRERRRQETLAAEASIEQDGPKRYAFREKRQKRERFEADIFAKKSYTAVPTGYQLSAEIPPDQVQGLQLFVYRKKRRARAGSARPGGDAGANGETRGLEPRDRLESVSVTGTVSDAGDAEDEAVAAGVREGVSRAGSTEEASRDRRHQKPTRNGPGRPRIHPPSASLLGHRGMGEAARRAGLGMGALRSSQNQKEERRAPVQDLEGRREEESAVGLDANRGGLPKKRTEALKAASEKKKLPSDGSRGFKRTVVAGGKKRDGRRKQSDGEDEDEESEVAVISEDNARKIREQFFQDAAAVEEYLPFGLYYGDSLASDTALLERQEDTRKERYLEAKKAFQREMFQRLFLASVMREEGVKAERARRENEGAGVIATSEASSARAPARAAEITEEAEVNEEAEKGKASQEAEEDGRGVKVEGGECASSAESRPRETSERQGCREREKTLERSSSAAGDVGDSSPSLTRRRERRQSSVASPASSSAAQEGLADERVFSVSAACPRAVKTEEPAGGAALTDGEARDSSALRGKAASQEASDGAAAKDDEASRMEDEATVVEVPGGRSGETPDGTASREERDANKENKAAQHLWEYAPLPFPAQAPTAEGFFSEILARETVKEDTETRRQATKSLQASAASLLQAAARLAESRPFMNSLAASFSSSGPRWREEEKEDAKSEEQEKGKKARREEERTKERDRGEKEESGEQKMRACSREGLRVGPLLSPLEGREASRGPAPVGLFGAVQEDAKKLKPAFSAVTSSLSRLLRVLPPSVLHDSLPPRMRLSSGALAALAKEERAGRGEEPQTKREEAQDAHGGSESSKDAEATEGDTQREGEKSRWESRSPGHLSSTPAASTFAVGTAEKETRTREETNAEEPDVAPLHRGRPGSALSEKRLFFDSNTFAHVPLRQLRCWAAPPGLRPARPVSWRRVRALLRAAGARRLARLQAESQRQGVFYAPASGDWEALSVIHPVVSWEGNEGLEGLRHPGLLFAEEGEETDSCDCSDDEGVATAGSGCTKKNKDSGSLAAELQADAPRASPPAGASSGRGVSWRGLVLAEATGSAAGSAPEPGGSSSGSSGAAPAAGASHAKAAVPALPASLPAAVCQPFLAARATLQARQEEKRMGLPPPLPVRPHCLSADLAAVAKALWSPTGGCHVVGSADRHWQRVDRVLNAFHLSQVAQTKGAAKPGEIEEKGEDRRETKPETLPAFDASLLPANFKNLLEPVHFFPAEQDLEAQARLLEQARALARAHSPSQGAATAKGPKAAGSRGPGDPLGSPTGGGDSSGKASSKKRPGLDPFGPALSEEERKGEQRSAAGPAARDGAGDVEGARKDSQGGSQGGEKSGLTCSAASLKKLQTDAANNPEVEADIRQLLLWRWRKESASPVLFGPGATALEPQGPGDEETPRPETATEKPESEEERENGDVRAEACAKTHGNVEGGKKRLLADAERKEDRDGLREEESGKRRRNEEERGKEGKRLSTSARASAGRPGADCGAHDGDETPTSLSAATTAAPGSTVGSASAEEGEKAFGRDKPAGTGQGESGARPRRSAARTRLAEVLTAVKGGSGPGSGESGPGGTPSGPGASSAPFSVSSASQPFGAPASPAEALGSSGSASPGALGATGEGAVAVAVAAPGTPPLKCLLRLLRHYPLSVLAQRLGVHRSTVARWAKMWTRQQIEEEGEEDGDELEGPVASSASSVRGLDA